MERDHAGGLPGPADGFRLGRADSQAKPPVAMTGRTVFCIRPVIASTQHNKPLE
jgi:hypothetical protein